MATQEYGGEEANVMMAAAAATSSSGGHSFSYHKPIMQNKPPPGRYEMNEDHAFIEHNFDDVFYLSEVEEAVFT